MFANAFGQFGEINLGSAAHAAFFRFLNERVEKRFVVHAARDGIQQKSGWRSIRDAMIEREAQNTSVTCSQLPVAHDGTLRDSSDAKNGGLRAVENRRESINGVNAKVADGRGSAFEMRWLQVAGQGAVG
jgi:hypothetical protein